MAKKKKEQILKMDQFFGICNTYRVFALQSEQSIFPFVNQLSKAANTSFSLLHTFVQNSNQYAAYFSVFYAEYSQQEVIHCLLLQNKAPIINQEELFVSKSEKNLRFQTLSLFDEYLYLFNEKGLRCMDSNFENIDYLLLLYAKKDTEKEMFLKFLQNLSHLKIKELSDILIKPQTSMDVKISAYFKDFYCKYEVKANRFSRKKEAALLAPVQQIPVQNRRFPIPVRLDNPFLADHVQLSEDYLAFLKEE